MTGKFITLTLLLFCAAPSLRSQDVTTPQRAFEAVIAGGYAHYIAPYGVPVSIDRAGAAMSLRLNWRPEHRLRVGLETGWTTMYSYHLTDIETSFGKTDADLRVTAVPLLVVFSMPIMRSLELYAGTGGYFLRSHAASFASTTDVTTFSQGWAAGVSWEAFSGASWGMGTRVGWYSATEMADAVVPLQLLLRLDFFHY